MIACLAFIGASLMSAALPANESGTATFHVGAMSCVSCEKSIRGNLAKFKQAEVMLASAEKKRVELRFDSSKVSMQQILSAIAGKDGKYEARLALRYEDPKVTSVQAEKTRDALMKTPGVRAAGLPDANGVILITFRPKPAAMLPAILAAAQAAGTTLRDPEAATAESGKL